MAVSVNTVFLAYAPESIAGQTTTMLIYLDTMTVQYCVDYEEFVFGEITGHGAGCPVSEPKLKRELLALRQLIFLDQHANLVYACTPDLLKELSAGKATDEQRKVYGIFSQVWKESGWSDAFPLEESEVARIETSLRRLNLRHSADRRHLAEAIALKASWFLTNDKEIIQKCKGQNLPLHVSRPSDSIDEMFVGLFLR